MTNPRGIFTLVPNADGTFGLDLHFDSISDFSIFVSLLRGADDPALKTLADKLSTSTAALDNAVKSQEPLT